MAGEQVEAGVPKPLETLIDRIQQPRTLLSLVYPETIPKPEESFETSKNLLCLIDRIETRRWLEEEIPWAKLFIKECKSEIKDMDHIEQCKECLMIMQLDVERYYGSRSVWWIDLQNDDALEWNDHLQEGDPEAVDDVPWMWKGMPRAENYKIGSYWSGSSEDTVRFIKDRIKWARDVNLKRMVAARKYLKLLKKWDFKEETKLKAAELRNNFLLW